MKLLVSIAILSIFTLLSVKVDAQNDLPSEEQICKAAISFMMGRETDIMKTSINSNGIVNLEYVRPDDKSEWKYRCRIEGEKVIWASEDGPWRTRKGDTPVLFSVNGSELTISEKYSDGSNLTKTYDWNTIK